MSAVRRILPVTAATLALLCIVTQSLAAELHGAAVAVDITPLRLPVSMTGGFQDRQATAVHDRLHARCLTLDDGRTRIAIVICDSCLISRDIYDAAKAAASKATGIRLERILTAATHTHTAPTAVPLAQCQPDADYVKHLTQQITQSIVAANEKLQPVQIGWGVVSVPDEINNRRWHVKPVALKPNPFGRHDDQVRTNPPRDKNVLIEPAGPVDPDVTFVALRSAAEKPIGLLANYGLHYVGGIPANQLSADYFGEFARQMRARLNASETFVGIMSNGASGDVNNYRFADPRPRREPFVRVREVATRLSDAVAVAHAKVDFISNSTIRTSEREIELAVRKPDAAELDRARSLLAGAADPGRLTMDEVYAQESVRLSEARPTVRIRLQTFVVGDLAIVAIPCEVFAEIGRDIKRLSPFRTTFVISLANGYNGYLPTPKQHGLGGYETWRSGWSYLATDASTRITRSVIDQLQSIKTSGD